MADILLKVLPKLLSALFAWSELTGGAPEEGEFAVTSVAPTEAANGTSVESDPLTIAVGQSLLLLVANVDAAAATVVWDEAGANESLGASLATCTAQAAGRTGRLYFIQNPTPGVNKTIKATWGAATVAPALYPVLVDGVDEDTPFDVSSIVTFNNGTGDGPFGLDIPSNDPVDDLAIAIFMLSTNAETFTASAGTKVADEAATNYGFTLLQAAGDSPEAAIAGDYSGDTFGVGGIGINLNRAGSVAPPVLTEFTVTRTNGQPINTQGVDVAFNVLITARDQYGNPYTAFTDTVEVSSDGSLSAGEGTSASFVAGVLTHSLTFDAEATDITISVEDSATGLILGESSDFDVAEPEGAFPPAGFVLLKERLGAETQVGWNTFNEIGDSVTSVADWLRITYPTGMGGGGGAGDIYPSPENINDPVAIAVRFTFRLSANYFAHPGSTNKLVIFRLGDGQPDVFLNAAGAEDGPLFFSMQTQGTVSHPSGVVYTTSTEIVRGQTYVVDMLVFANSADGVADGGFTLSVDGVPQTFTNGQGASNDADDIEWETGTPNVYNATISPIWGGSGSTVPEDIYIESQLFAIAIPE